MQQITSMPERIYRVDELIEQLQNCEQNRQVRLESEGVEAVVELRREAGIIKL